MAKPRVAFIGNCQAQALASMAGHLGLPLEVVPTPANFDLPAFGTPEIWRDIKSCDFVFNQRVASDYPVEFARPDFLKNTFGDRSISWPNVYFDGYFPGIQYLYLQSGKVVGPLADYHFDFVRSAWAHGVEVNELCRSFRSGPLATSFVAQADRSLNELRRREDGLTVRMSDWIVARWRYEKLLFVMNHPGNPTLLELMRRLLRAAGIDAALNPAGLAHYPYTLDQIRLPPFPAIHQQMHLRFAADQSIVGTRVEVRGVQAELVPGTETYSWEQLFEAYFRLYNKLQTVVPSASALLRAVAPWDG